MMVDHLLFRAVLWDAKYLFLLFETVPEIGDWPACDLMLGNDPWLMEPGRCPATQALRVTSRHLWNSCASRQFADNLDLWLYHFLQVLSGDVLMPF